jgi:hypothetical protein
MASRSSRAPPWRRRPPAKRATPGKTTGCAPNRTIHPTRAARLTRLGQAQISTPATTALATSRRPQGNGPHQQVPEIAPPRLPPPSRRGGPRDHHQQERAHHAQHRAGTSNPLWLASRKSPSPLSLSAGRSARALMARRMIEICSVRLLQRLGWEPRRASPSEPTRSASSSAGLSSGSIPFVWLVVLLARSQKWVLRRRVE